LKSDECHVLLDEQVVNIINYLQKSSFHVKSEVVNLYLSNLEVLKESIEASWPKEKSAITSSIVKLVNNKLKILSFKESNYYLQNKPEEYNNAFQLLVLFIEGLGLASTLMDEPHIYNAWFLDFRLRLYSVGYPLSSQGNSFTRRFFEMKVPNKPIRLDACCSGLSIIAGLTGSVDVLFDTNVLKFNKAFFRKANNERKDFYSSVLVQMTKLFTLQDAE
jgi:hypothetical protein